MITLLRSSLIDPLPVAEHRCLFSEGRRGWHKAVRRLLLRRRDARWRQPLNSGHRCPIFGVQQETDGHPDGGRENRDLQPQGPSSGKAHPTDAFRPFLCAPAAIDTLPPRPMSRALRLSCFSCGLEMSCYLSNILTLSSSISLRSARLGAFRFLSTPSGTRN